VLATPQICRHENLISTRVNAISNISGARIGVVVNAAAGSARNDPTDDIAAALPNADIIRVGPDESIVDALERATGASVLGILGGDGSINAAAENALATQRPLAVFPGGTLNHFARDLGIGETADTVAALHADTVTAVDVGLIDGKPFLNTASFGTYAELVDVRDKLEPRFGKWLSMLIGAAKVLRHAQPVRVEIDGERHDIWMIFIGNCEYQPPGLAPASRARLDDGQFDVRYVDTSASKSRTRLLAALAFGRLAHTKAFTRVLVQSLDIHALDGALRLARDGETSEGATHVRVEKHQQRLPVYCPRAPS
jgi:diacylglycerol kinase family enzyme